MVKGEKNIAAPTRPNPVNPLLVKDRKWPRTKSSYGSEKKQYVMINNCKFNYMFLVIDTTLITTLQWRPSSRAQTTFFKSRTGLSTHYILQCSINNNQNNYVIAISLLTFLDWYKSLTDDNVTNAVSVVTFEFEPRSEYDSLITKQIDSVLQISESTEKYVNESDHYWQIGY